MKDNLKNSIVSGLVFGILMSLFYRLIMGEKFGIITGLISGLIFGILICIFSNVQGKKLKKSIQAVIGDKTIVYDGGANHFVKAESVGGWLCLTQEELIFLSHKLNFQNHQMIIPINQIMGVRASKTLGFIPNGMQVITKAGVEKFVVNKRKEWVEKIEAAIDMEIVEPE